MNTRRPAESWYDQSRVIREYQPVSVSRIIQRLTRRVFGKGRSIFLESKKRVEIRQQLEFYGERHCRGERTILHELPRIGRGKKKLSGRAH
jgi:hypothetical protein